MPRTHSYSAKGHRCYGAQDWDACSRTNVIGALTDKELLTVSLFDQNVNTEVLTIELIMI